MLPKSVVEKVTEHQNYPQFNKREIPIILINL